MSKYTKILALSLCLASAAVSAMEKKKGNPLGKASGIANEVAENMAKEVGNVVHVAIDTQTLHTLLKAGAPVAKKLMDGTRVGDNIPKDELIIADAVAGFFGGVYSNFPTVIQKGVSDLSKGVSESRANNYWTRTGLAFSTTVLKASLVEWLFIKMAGHDACKKSIVKGNFVEMAVVEVLEAVSGEDLGAARGIVRVVAGKVVQPLPYIGGKRSK